jgi:hypothetical protein
LKILGAVVLLLNLGLSLVVGARLLARSFAPGLWVERFLAVYFLVGVCVGGSLVTAAYAGWSDPSLGLPEAWIAPLHAAGSGCIAVGTVAVLLFTHRTFRAGQHWAAAVAVAGTLALVGSFAARCVSEGFAISTDPGPIHWLLYWLRIGALGWMASEAIAYWVRTRRRLELGLIDPMVANRFALWSVWAGATLSTALSEVVARAIYHWVGGDAGSSDSAVRGLAAPIIVISLTITSTTGLVAAGSLFLTFFPTAGYRGWVEHRARRADG